MYSFLLFTFNYYDKIKEDNEKNDRNRCFVNYNTFQRYKITKEEYELLNEVFNEKRNNNYSDWFKILIVELIFTIRLILERNI